MFYQACCKPVFPLQVSPGLLDSSLRELDSFLAGSVVSVLDLNLKASPSISLLPNLLLQLNDGTLEEEELTLVLFYLRGGTEPGDRVLCFIRRVASLCFLFEFTRSSKLQSWRVRIVGCDSIRMLREWLAQCTAGGTWFHLS